MILVYAAHATPRMCYLCHVIFRSILQNDFSLTDDKNKFDTFQGPKIGYFASHSILFEDNITRQDEASLLNDPWALSFFVLSCYEEYLPGIIYDQHGRSCSDSSFLVRHHLEKKAVVHRFALDLKNEILKNFPDTLFLSIPYRFQPTIDVDAAYCIKGKSVFRKLLSIINNILLKDFHKIKKIFESFYNKDFKDDFDVFDNYEELFGKYSLKTLYFWLTATMTKHDRNISPYSTSFKMLLNKQKKYADIGLHPSYYAVTEDKLKKEKTLLEHIIAQPVTSSRQHYLRLFFPDTFSHLISVGITDDYSLGYCDRAGFRAGMCTPFPFFNIKENKQTALILHPLLFMDSALLKKNLSHDDFLEALNEIIDEVNHVKGEMTALWHNAYTPRNSANYLLFVDSFNLMVRYIE